MAKKDTARGGVHYDEQSKTWGFRVLSANSRVYGKITWDQNLETTL